MDVPKEAPHNMLEQSHRLLLNKLRHHVVKHSADSIEPFVGSTNVVKPDIIKQNLLHDKDSNCFAELTTGLHDAKT